MKKIELTEYTLPVYWASYLVNDDYSGITQSEVDAIEAWRARECVGHCVGVSDDHYFAHINDANNLGGDVAVYTFDNLGCSAQY